MKVQLVTPYRVSLLQRYGVTVHGNVTSVYPPLDRAVTRLGYSTRNRRNPSIFRDGMYGHILVINALRGKNGEQTSCRQKSHGPESCESSKHGSLCHLLTQT